MSTPCRGDSGGPLIKNVLGIDTLVGVVSFGSLDCDPSIPSVYTSVAHFAGWIQDFLDLTNVPSRLHLTGKGKTIRNGDRSPRRADGTDFGRRKSKRTQAFVLRNAGEGLLTVRHVAESHRNFRIRRAPARLIESGGASKLKVLYRPRKRPRKARTLVKIYTNDPQNSIYVFKIRRRSKR
ncbi:MAG: trypsin-like serine protease [Verrucomicrobiales bacterium]